MCLSSDYQLGYRYSRKFGGFFSCQTQEAERKCPDGYSQHIATTLTDCDVYYCVRPEAFTEVILPTIKRPPFTNPSVMLSNASESMVYGYLSEKVWLKAPLYDILKEVSTRAASRGLALNADNTTGIIDEWISEETRSIVSFMKRVGGGVQST